MLRLNDVLLTFHLPIFIDKVRDFVPTLVQRHFSVHPAVLELGGACKPASAILFRAENRVIAGKQTFVCLAPEAAALAYCDTKALRVSTFVVYLPRVVVTTIVYLDRFGLPLSEITCCPLTEDAT